MRGSPPSRCFRSRRCFEAARIEIRRTKRRPSRSSNRRRNAASAPRPVPREARSRSGPWRSPTRRHASAPTRRRLTGSRRRRSASSTSSWPARRGKIGRRRRPARSWRPLSPMRVQAMNRATTSIIRSRHRGDGDAAIVSRLRRRRGQVGPTASRSRDDPRISRGLRTRTGLVRADTSTRFPACREPRPIRDHLAGADTAFVLAMASDPARDGCLRPAGVRAADRRQADGVLVLGERGGDGVEEDLHRLRADHGRDDAEGGLPVGAGDAEDASPSEALGRVRPKPSERDRGEPGSPRIVAIRGGKAALTVSVFPPPRATRRTGPKA